MEEAEVIRLTHNRSRTPSPQLFDNNLSDIESTEDYEDDNEVKTATFQIEKSTDSASKLSDIGNGNDKTQAKNITKPNFMSRQPSREAECIDTDEMSLLKNSPNYVSELEKDFEHEVPIDINSNGNQVSREKQTTSDRRPMTLINSLRVDSNLFPPKELTDQFDYDDWIGSWTLSEDDLIVKGRSADPTIRIDPSLTESAREPASMHGKIRWPTVQKIYRAYHYRPSKHPKSEQCSKMSKIMSKSSPFTILSTIAAQYNIKLKDLLEKYDETTFNEQFPVRFPCMQCYEKIGAKANWYDAAYGGSYDGYYDDYGSHESTELDKCKKCGGKTQTMATFIKMVVELKDKFESNNLVVHDVYPDGNCLFAAVVDQLRIRGVFEYTNQNLRQASVDYLRENPISSDGETHFELFLSDETWEDYLTRMSQDGEWGDHMVLSAIANITNQRILIFGGRSGVGQTIILPTNLQEPLPPNDPRKQTNETEPCTSEDKSAEEEMKSASKETFSNEQSKDIQAKHEIEADKYGKEENNKQQDWKIKITEKAKTKNDDNAEIEAVSQADFEDIGEESNKETETEEDDWRDFDKTGTIFLGHFGESHYVSLRPKDWQDKSYWQTKKCTLGENEGDITQDYRALESKIPLGHINFFLRHFFIFEYLQSKHSDRIDFVHLKSESEFAREEGVGQVVNKLAPYLDEVKIIGPDMGTFFPVENDDGTTCYQQQYFEVMDDKIRTLLFIPKDTSVRFEKKNALKFDLLAVKMEDYPDLTRLIPLRAEKWHGATVTIDGTEYLEAIEPKEHMLLAFQMEWPEESNIRLKSNRPSNWPDSKTMKTVFEEGCHMVPVLLAKKFKDFQEELAMLTAEQKSDHSLWTVCFAISERIISSSLTTAQLNAFYLFQSLLDFVFKDKCLPAIAYRYTFFYACENIRLFEWDTQPGACLLKLLRRLSDSLRVGILPHYFNPSINIFRNTTWNTLKECQERVDFVCGRLTFFILFLLDKYKITNSEIGFLLDEVIEDVFNYQIHNDIKRSVREKLAAASLTLVSTFVYGMEYDFALNTFLCLMEQLKNEGVDSASTAEIVSKAITTGHPGYQWCFALYVDIKQGTMLTQEILKGLPSVRISKVFGPEVLTFLPATVVPKQYAAVAYDLYFPLEVSHVLKIAGYTQAIATGIRYYVDTLFDYLYGPSTQKVTMDTAYAYLLHKLLVSLYDSYEDLGQKEEFRDLLPRFIKISGKTGRDVSYTVEKICITLGEEEKIKTLKGKSPSPFSLLFSLKE